MKDIIIKWKLNKRVLAEKIGMTVNVFNNKLNPKHKSAFSQQELFSLRNAMIELMNEIDTATDIDFNDALKTMLEVK